MALNQAQKCLGEYNYKCYNFLPVILVASLQINTIEKTLLLKQLKCYTKISGRSAATKFDVNLHLF